MEHSPGFLKIVSDAKRHVNEISVAEASGKMGASSNIVLMDVREDHEWIAGHAAGAVHLGKGVLERDLEKKFPDPNVEIIMYCGGGFRSALTCEVAKKMGYHNVHSLIGGYRAIVAAGWTVEKPG